MATKARLEALIDAEVKNKAVQDAKDDGRSLSNHVEKVLKDHKPLPKPFVSKQEYEK